MRLMRHAIGLLAAVTIWIPINDSASARPMITDDGGRAMRFAGSIFQSGGDLVGDAMRFLGAGNITGTRGPWCADFASAILKRNGRRPLLNRMAASALAYGPPTNNPKRGDLVVMNTRAGRAHHVGFFVGFTHGGVQIVSGNWSHRVKIAIVPRQSIYAFIRV